MGDLSIKNSLRINDIFFRVITSGSVVASPQSGTIKIGKSVVVGLTGASQEGQVIPVLFKNDSMSSGHLRIDVKVFDSGNSEIDFNSAP